MRTMRFVLLVACVIAIFLLIAGCKNTKELNSEPGVPQPAAFEQRPEPVSAGADAGNEADAAGYLEAEAGEPGETENDQDTTSNPEADGSAGQLYGLVFEAMMPIDEALNEDLKYIAIDFSVLTQLTEEDKQYIEEYISSRFAAPVRDATFEQLKESEGDDFTVNGMVLSGVLLQIDKVEISEHGAVIEGMKYRSGNGAVGIAIQLELKDGAWKVIEATNTWIS
ncbi:hypothetical protein [Paenibacillus woosongensis]|uniref:Uncharacterized protein n=1 Tax=Paenibacillus woosongensis TaxID=307580 RepID=A0A7X2Z412_9BACL|nr:hypothetical protein [Paenibacillus woosongensis]MUG46354.1 hypothetical protein [Paenibacillus woosongensis]